MATWTNSLEGGTSGVAITTANSGGASGNAFDDVSALAGQTLEFSNVFAAHGSLSMKVASGATGGQVYGAVKTSLGTTFTTIGGRLYFYLTAAPAAFQGILRFTSGGGGTNRAIIGVNTARRLQVLTAASTTSATGTMALIPIGAWCRIEFAITLSATVGQVDARMWLTPDSTGTADETNCLATSQNYGGTADSIRVGMVSGSLASSVVQYIDDAVFNDLGTFPGPYSISAQVLAPTSDITTTGWSFTPAGAAWSTLDEPTADDGDFVTSPNNPSSSVMEVKLGAGTDPLSSVDHSFAYRIRSNTASSSTVVVGLYQGTSLIASETRSAVPSSFTTYTMTLTGPQADLISDYTDLRMRFTATAS